MNVSRICHFSLRAFGTGRRFAALCLVALASLVADDSPPAITTQSGDQTVFENDYVTVGVTATGTAPLGYYWTLNGTNLTTFTNSVVTYSSVSTNAAGTYQVVVSNALGTATSQPALLTVQPNVPRILTDLQDQTVVEGAVTAIGVISAGATPIYHYWYREGTNLADVFGPSILFAPIAAADAGTYQVVVSNVLGAVTSRVATVVVKPNTPRQVRTGRIEFPDAASLVVPVTFAAQGDENTLGFSLAYNAAQLSQPVATFTPTAQALLPEATFTVDPAEAAAGRIGFRVELPPGRTMPTQTFRIAEVRLQAGGVDWSQAGLAFGSAPVPLGATGATNAALPVLDIVTPVLQTAPMPASPDPQSGLFLQTLTLVNPGGLKMDGLLVLVQGLTNDTLGRPVRLYNASGETNAVPFLYYGPLLPGATTSLTAEYYVADRRTPPVVEYEPLIVPTWSYVASGGQVFSITSGRYTNGVFLLDFHTFAGRQYFIQYVDSATSSAWKTAVPGILGTGNRVQWIDNGPPKTQSLPAGQTNRFYRGMLMP